MNLRFITFWLIFVPAVAAEGPRIPGEVRRTSERIGEATELVVSQPDKALQQLMQIVQDAGDDLVPLPNSPVLLPARVAVFERIAGNSVLRERYVSEFEQRAAALFQDANSRRDQVGLQRVVSNYPVTTAATRAAELLGDFAFERGDFATARQHWQGIRSAQCEAKVLLASAFLREPVDVAEFRRRFPNSSGRLAGSDGVLANLLDRVVKTQSRELPTGIAGAHMTELAPHNVAEVHTWPWASAMTVSRPLVFPLVSDGLIWINEGHRLLAIDSGSGKAVESFDREDDPRPIHTRPEEPLTVSAAESRVLAKLPSSNGGVVVCAERSNATRWKLAWRLPATSLGEGASWEGTPVVRGGRLYASWNVVNGGRRTAHVGCFSVRDPSLGPIWSRPVAEVPSVLESRRPRSQCVALAGSHLIYVSDAGVIAAVESASGRPAWTTRYPSRGPRGLTADLLPSPRESGACLLMNGRLIAAPVDSAEVLALDQATGKSLWPRNPPLEAVQFLGTIGTRIVLTAQGVYRGIGAIDALTGQVISEWGNLDASPPVGHGVLIDQFVLLPSRAMGVLVVDANGRPVFAPTQFRNLPAGNLSYCDGVLAVAATEGLVVVRYDVPAGPAKLQVGSGVEFPKRVPELRSLKPAWATSTPIEEIPLAATDGRLTSRRGDALVTRSLPGGKELWVTDIGFPVEKAIWTESQLIALGSDGEVVLNAEGKELSRRRPSDLVAERKRLPGADVRLPMDESVSNRQDEVAIWINERHTLKLAQPNWSFAEALPATHRFTAALVETASGAIVDRYEASCHGPAIAFHASDRNLTVALTGTVIRFEAP